MGKTAELAQLKLARMLIATSLTRNFSYKIVKSCSAPNFKGLFVRKHEMCENDSQFFHLPAKILKKVWLQADEWVYVTYVTFGNG